MRMAEQIQKAILKLPEYGVFDDIRFGIKDYAVLLRGSASRPILKSAAPQAVKRMAGVQSVMNEINVSPLSTLDDNIRAGAYVAIYYYPALSRYNPEGACRAPRRRGSPAITNNPPIGFHLIDIIVGNGNIILTGWSILKRTSILRVCGRMGFRERSAVDNQSHVVSESKPGKG